MYYLEIFLTRLLVLLFANYQLRGKENVPRSGPLLVVANHLSMADPPVLGISLGRRAIFMAKEELFRNRFTGFFVRQFGAFPVYRERPSPDAIRQASRVLKQGKVLVMFPEGKRSKAGGLDSGFFGSALIAYHNQVPILPVGITGTEKIRGLWWIWRRPGLTFTIGQPFQLPVGQNALTREQLALYTDVIMRKIAELLPEKYQGNYCGADV